MQLFQIKALSEASLRFYRSTMHQVDDYNVRRIFQQRADIYEELIHLLNARVTHTGTANNEQLEHAITWFETAQASIHNFDNLIFLDFLDTQENTALNALKQSVKLTDDKYLSTSLAQCAASLQVNQDALSALKAQYRAQQSFTNVLT